MANILAFALPVTGIIVALLTKSISGTWLHPTAIFAGVWTVLSIVLIIIPGLYDASWLSVFVLITLVASLIFVGTGRRVSNHETIRVESHRPGLIIVGLSPIAGVLVGLVSQAATGSGFSLSGFLSTARDVSIARYASGAVTSIVIPILLSIVYAGALLAPFVAAGAQRRWRKWFWIACPIVGATFYGIATTAKAGLFITVALVVGTWMANRLLAGGPNATLPRGVLIASLVIACLLVGFFFISSVVRYGGFTPQVVEIVRVRMGTYSVGAMPAFDEWFTNSNVPLFSFGTQTFSGLLGPIGHTVGTTRAVDEFVSISASTSSNVYTIFGDLFGDFGVVGGLLVLLVVMMAAAAAFQRTAFHHSIRGAMAYGILVAFILFSGFSSIFTFSSICVASLLVVVLAPAFVSRECQMVCVNGSLNAEENERDYDGEQQAGGPVRD